eukprot:GEMP01039132.1.p1 GENE.GEMP01039132.1~~GEMP01039132.1.p1  ORF type:complete len:433 (+),score=123.18 GEMP01039132.1:22-1299(+)
MLTLYAHPDNYKTNKALICAKHNGLEVNAVSNFDKAPPSPFGKVPVLETENGCIFSTNAIVRYLARMRRDLCLSGRNFIENGMVDSWMEWASVELEVPLCTITYPLLGLFENVPQAAHQARIDVKDALNVLEKHLLSNTFIVGHQITVADISLVCALHDAFRLAFDANFRNGFPNVMRWYDLIINQPAVKAVLKDTTLLGEDKAVGSAAPKPKAKQEPKAKAKQAASPKAKAKVQAKPPGKPEPTPEEAREKLLQKVKKEGGKRGVEIEGASDMGGLEFFCTCVDAPEGDLELLQECLTAMNEKSDPLAEERKGGAGNVGKMVFSSGSERLAIVCDVPAEKRGKIAAKEWMEVVLLNLEGKLVKGDDGVAIGEVLADPNKNRFPIKMKDTGIAVSIDHLKKKGLFPDKDDDSDDDYIFGDDDFPA